ncbi:MAG: EamA family transporter [Chloroflexota bacterium]|nr:EamA family transporter [Chloroflexota bacterium]
MAETTVSVAHAEPARVRHPARGYAFIVAGVALFAINGTVSKVILSTGLSAPRLTELRCAGAVLALGLLVLAVEPRRLRVSRSELPLLAAYGVLGVAFTQCFYFIAIARLPVSIALLFEYTAPVLVALWARFVMHEQVRSRVWVALGLALSGLALVAQVWRGGTLDGIGVAAALVAALALAAYYVLGEHSTGSRDPLSTTFWAFVFASVFWALVQPWWGFPASSLGGGTSLLGNLAQTSLPVWVLATWMVLLGTVAPFLLILSALHHLPATRVGLVSMLEPVLAGLVAWAWLNEALSPVQLAGAAVVLLGIVLAQTAR